MTGGREKENEMHDQCSLQKLKYIHTGNSHFIRTSKQKDINTCAHTRDGGGVRGSKGANTSMKRKASPATWKEVSGCGDMITSTSAPEG